MLLDTGAASPVMGEETVCLILNYAIQAGTTPDHEGWPLAALEYWGTARPYNTVELATGVAADAPLEVIGRVSLLTTFVGLDERRVEVPVYCKVLRKG